MFTFSATGYGAYQIQPLLHFVCEIRKDKLHLVLDIILKVKYASNAMSIAKIRLNELVLEKFPPH